MVPRIEISKRLVLLNTASAVVARTIYLSVILWLHQYLLRRIDPGEYQLLPLLTSIIVLLPLFTWMLTSGIGRFVLAAYAQGDDRGVTQIVSTMLPLLLAASGIILLGGGFLAWFIDRVLSVPPAQLWDARLMMALLILSTAIKPPLGAYGVGFFVQQKLVLYNLISVGGEMLRVLVLCALLFGVSTRVLWVVVANVAAELVVSIVALILSKRMIPALRFRRQEIRWERARELVSFGGWSSLGYLAFRMRETIVLWVLNRFATPLDVAVFNVGYLGRRQIDAWTDVMAGPLYPVVTGMHALGEKDRVRNIYLRGGRLALWLVLLVGLPAAIYAEPIIRLYIGQGYIEAAVIMVLTLAGLAVSGGSWMVWQVSNATGRVRATSLYVLTTQALTVAATYYTVRTWGWGATGVAVSLFTVGILAEALVLVPLAMRLADASFSAWTRETLIPGLTPGAVAAVVWAVLGIFVRPGSWSMLGLCTGAGAVCYLTVLLVFCLEPKDHDDLSAMVSKFTGSIRSYFRLPPQIPGGRVAEAARASGPMVPAGHQEP
jgi:O-antigen/teichoic acid export membrane protein